MKTMKTAVDVRRHIEKMMLSILERPDMIAVNPEALEGMLYVLDMLRLEIHSPERDFDHGYMPYLRSKGYRGGSCCFRHHPNAVVQQTPEDKKLFQKVARFWAKYLDSEYALKRVRKR